MAITTVDLGSVIGPQGPKGDTGDTGPQGPKGDRGDDGAANITAVNAVLSASGWSDSSPYTQSITVSGMDSSKNAIISVDMSATSAQYEASAAALLHCSAQGAESVTITAFGEKPAEDIPVIVLILG